MGQAAAPIAKPVMDFLHMSPEMPSMPALPAPPPSPLSADPEVAAKTALEQENAAKAERKTRGRASTLLTGGKGLTDEGMTSVKRTLGV